MEIFRSTLNRIAFEKGIMEMSVEICIFELEWNGMSEIFFFILYGVVFAADWCHLELFFDIHFCVVVVFNLFFVVQKC